MKVISIWLPCNRDVGHPLRHNQLAAVQRYSNHPMAAVQRYTVVTPWAMALYLCTAANCPTVPLYSSHGDLCHSSQLPHCTSVQQPRGPLSQKPTSPLYLCTAAKGTSIQQPTGCVRAVGCCTEVQWGCWEVAYRGGLLIQFNSQFWQSWRLWSQLQWGIVGGTWRSYRLSYKRHVYIGHQDMDIRSGYGY